MRLTGRPASTREQPDASTYQVDQQGKLCQLYQKDLKDQVRQSARRPGHDAKTNPRRGNLTNMPGNLTSDG